jgi:3-hydroxybutyryl-CoA dehydrogenase
MDEGIKTVAVIGAGFMGRQIAAWTATHGYALCIYVHRRETMEKAKESVMQTIKSNFEEKHLEGNANEVLKKITYHDKFSNAVANADLILEAVPEDLDLKKKVFAQIDGAAPPHAIIATNSSSIPVSRLEGSVERKDKVLNIHFYAPINKIPMADIMRGTKTSSETFEKGKAWVESIDCVPLVVQKECMGFVFNRVWRAVKKECLKIWAGGYADFRDVDRAWRIATGNIMGPFALMDMGGLDAMYAIELLYYKESGNSDDLPPQALKDMIDRGELGMKSGKGFYDWKDSHEFASQDFIKPKKRKQVSTYTP